MKLIVVAFFIGCAVADRLENNYLPPHSAATAGGNGNFLNAPFSQHHGSARAPQNTYLAPSSNYGAPARFGGSSHATQASFHSASSSSSHAFGGSFSGSQGGYHQPGPDAGAAILKFNNDNNGDGSYHYEYETDNRIQAHEAGELKNQGSEHEAQSVHGSYSYTGPDGKVYTVSYTADENGFHATGDHIPTPPPVPEAIQKSLQQTAAQGSNNYHGNNAYQSSGSFGHQQQNNFQSYQASSSRQYIPPSRGSFNQQSGYRY